MLSKVRILRTIFPTVLMERGCQMNCSIGWILVKQYENASPLNKVNLNT